MYQQKKSHLSGEEEKSCSLSYAAVDVAALFAFSHLFGGTQQ